MKQLLALLTTAVLAAGVLSAHDPNRGHADVSLGGKKISIEYGRPELQGRDMLSRLQPGQEWRTGMDDPTTLTSDADLTIGGATVPKGNYVIRTRLDGPGQWSLLLRDGTETKATIPMAVHTGSPSVEKFTITLQPTGADSAALQMIWGTLELRTDLKAN